MHPTYKPIQTKYPFIQPVRIQFPYILDTKSTKLREALFAGQTQVRTTVKTVVHTLETTPQTSGESGWSTNVLTRDSPSLIHIFLGQREGSTGEALSIFSPKP